MSEEPIESILEEALSGVIDCRECGAGLEPDAPKCGECGWLNPVVGMGMI